MKPFHVLAAAALLIGCDLESDPLWLAMTVDKTIVAMDDSIRVTLVISNTSNRAVVTHAQSEYGPCLPGFEVLDGEGRGVHMNVACLAIPPSTVMLQPGESFQVVTWWHPDISFIGSTAITPGHYVIRAGVKSDEEIQRSRPFDIVLTEAVN